MSYGIPLVTAGLTEDKADVNARVAWSGVGINLASNEPTPQALRQAVRTVLDRPDYRSRAELMADEFAGIDTRAEVLWIISELSRRSSQAGLRPRRAKALQIARQAERNAAKNENHATLGRYMLEMKHSVNNALTCMLGNAELLLLEPGQLSSQSLAQIKTMHSMAQRINDVMQRFSSLESEMQEAENASQAETVETAAPTSRRR